jgi:hypothetical protein
MSRMRDSSGSTPGDLRTILDSLESPDETTDIFSCLHRLGHLGGAEYEALVARYLEFPQQPMVSRMAIEVLTQWGVVGRHIACLKKYLDRVPWDSDDDVRQAAILAVGEFLRSAPSRELLAALIHTAGDQQERPLIRGDSVRALARALGRDWQEMPPATRREDPESPWSHEIRSLGETLLGAESG